MSVTGTYVYRHGQLVKLSEEIPSIAHRDAWMPTGDLGYFDKSAQRYFSSRKDKRKWLTQHGLREGGIVNPDRAPD